DEEQEAERDAGAVVKEECDAGRAAGQETHLVEKIKAEACHESAGRQPLRVFQQGMPRWIRTVEAQAMPVGLGLLRQNDASDARLLRCNIEFGGTLQQTAAAHIKKARIGILR